MVRLLSTALVATAAAVAVANPNLHSKHLEKQGHQARTTDGKYFDHIMIMMFENHAEDEVIKDQNFAKYTKMGRGLENYTATTHPSQPNYISLTSGDYFGENTDSNIDLDVSNIADLLEAKGLTWKGYMEDFPGNCDDTKSDGKYYRKHNPFMSYDNIRKNATRCANIVGLEQVDKDLEAGEFPNYSMLSPNIDNDAHNTDIAYGGKFLDGFLAPRLSKFPNNTLLVVTWDEDDYTEANKVLTFMIDPTVNLFKPGSVDDTGYNHYSLLKTVEDNWDLGDLGRNDADAIPIKFD